MQVKEIKNLTGIESTDAAILYATNEILAIDLIGRFLVEKQERLGERVTDPVQLAALYGYSVKGFKEGTWRKDDWMKYVEESMSKIEAALNEDE